MMKHKTHKRFTFHLALFILIVGLFYGCHSDTGINPEDDLSIAHPGDESINQGAAMLNEEELAIEAPPFSDGIYPCSFCHLELEPNPERRELELMHDDISGIFDHDAENRWCLDCHDLNSRDSLRLASGKLIGFDESYKLCGQCHGDKLRDWKVGVHGKRTGYWNGKKQYLLCVHCHNPHSPRFKPIKPLPPPVRQKDIQK